MPTTTTTTTATGASGTTTTTATETRSLQHGTAKYSLVVQAPAEAVLPLIKFTKLIPSSPSLAAILTQEVSDGDNVGSVRTLKGIPGGPFDGKVITETCIDNDKGHTYMLDLGEHGSPTYALPVEVEAYQGTFSCDEINASTCVLSWCAHYQTSDPAMLKGMLEEMIGGALAAIAESATASGGRKAISWPTKTPTVKGSCNCGAVSYVLDTNKLVLNAYCYCKDCQQAHGSICTAATIVPNDGIEWTGLDTNVERFNRAEHEGRAEGGISNNRVFCKTCKAHLCSELSAMGMYGIFHPSIKEGSPGPQHAHIFAAELPAHYVIGEDGIPIYPGFPPAFGGGEPDRAADPALAPHLA